MKQQRYYFYLDKLIGFIFFSGLLITSFVIGLAIYFSSNSTIYKVTVSSISFLFFTLSSIALIGVFSNRWTFFYRNTKEYNERKVGELDRDLIFSVFADRLQSRISDNKRIYYKDVTSITIIPAYDDTWDVICNFIEITSATDKFFIMHGQEKFIEAFQNTTGYTLPALPTDSETYARFGKRKVILASFLGRFSPLRIRFWSSDNGNNSR